MADQRLPILPTGAVPEFSQPQFNYIAPPPQQSTQGPDLISTLAALGGLAGNIAGGLTNHGAAGNSLLSFAHENQQQTQQRADRQTANQREAYGIGSNQHQINSLKSQIDALPPEYQKEATAFAETNDVAGVESVTARYRADLNRNKEKRDETAKYVGPLLREQEQSLKETDKSLAGDESVKLVDNAQKLSQFFAGRPKFFGSALEMQAELNKNSKALGLPGKVDYKQANQIFQSYNNHLDTKKQDYDMGIPGVGSVAKSLFGIGKLPDGTTPKDVFSDFHTTQVSPDMIAQADQVRQKRAEVQQGLNDTRDAYKGLANPKTRQQTIDKITSIDGGKGNGGPEEMVKVTSPDGQSGSIPKSKVDAAKKKGFKIAQ